MEGEHGNINVNSAGTHSVNANAFSNSANLDALDCAISEALQRDDLVAAAYDAERKAGLLRSSKWYCPQYASLNLQPPTMLTEGKLRHDLEQLLYLQDRKVLPKQLAPYVANFRTVLNDLGTQSFVRRELNEAERELIGEVYGRIIWRPPADRQSAVLSKSWNSQRVEEAYFDDPIGVVVIDNVLTPSALESLRRFCVESTIWFENRYRFGRLGTFFRDGFNCPLLVQLAEEFRAAFSKVIRGHALEQLWAFKYEAKQPTTLPHADFAVVNVNIWLTSEQANMDPDTGGMIIYDVPTPPDWDFNKYNTRGDIIAEYLMRKRAQSLRIPYRGNRAIVFNSRYFHKTDVIDFKPNFADRRVNLTLLFGRHEANSRRGA
jgi:hypothetical protein